MTAQRNQPDEVAMLLGAANRWNALVDSITEADWPRVTPCAGWTVADLVVHVIERNRNLVAQLEGETPDAERQRRAMAGERITLAPDDDLIRAWQEEWAWWQERLDDPSRRTAVVATPLGQLPLATAGARINTLELAVHAWDLARGLGVDDTLDPELAEFCVPYAQKLDRDRLPSGLFAPARSTAAGASAQERLLALVGRHVERS